MKHNIKLQLFREIEVITSFEKDLKKYSNNKKVLSMFNKVANELLINGKVISEKFKPHPLTGNYKVFFECHLLPDVLLI